MDAWPSFCGVVTNPFPFAQPVNIATRDDRERSASRDTRLGGPAHHDHDSAPVR